MLVVDIGTLANCLVLSQQTLGETFVVRLNSRSGEIPVMR
jgi:hypothetical protein